MSKPGQAINLPPRVQSGMAITAAQLNAIRESIARLARSGVPDGPKVYPRRVRQAFWPVLSVDPDSDPESPDFLVSLTPGFVVERITKSGTDSLVYHAPDGIYEKDDEGNDTENLALLPITEGQVLAVVVNVLPDGSIGIDSEEDPPPPAVLIDVIADSTQSTHHEPPIGDGNEGEAGIYYYKIAKLTEGALTFAPGTPGHDIDHWIDLPTFESAGGETIWKEWDGAAAKYMTKGIVGVDGISVTATTDTLEIGFNGAENLHLQVIEVDLSIDFTAETFSFGGSLGVVDHYWENGLYVGTTEPTDPEYDPIFQRVTHIANTNANP